jgi:hypothetical protein
LDDPQGAADAAREAIALWTHDEAEELERRARRRILLGPARNP